MSFGEKFVELDKAQHDRASFDCGEPELNQFLQMYALKHTKAGISRTLVLPSKQVLSDGKTAICAFYSLAPSTIERNTLPNALAKKLPRYPVPVFLLAQLAVDKKFHGQGLGKISLLHALKYLYEASRYMPAYAVVVDCLSNSAETFYSQYGFQELCKHNGRMRLFMPMSTIQQLFA